MNWRARLLAATAHLIATVLVASLAAVLIFGFWYPSAFAQMVGGSKLFTLVIGCDLALGPLVSLVIYNTQKPRRELVRDYFIVCVLQLAVLVYGISVVAQSRPVFVVFVADRFEVITAQELDDKDLGQGKSERFSARSWAGPRLAGIQFPTDLAERNQLVFLAVLGRDIQLMPKYYVAYESVLDVVRARALALSALVEKHAEVKTELRNAVRELGVAETELRWVPVRSRFGFWTALIDMRTGYPIYYLPVDPY